jgi:hypothetical protein
VVWLYIVLGILLIITLIIFSKLHIKIFFSHTKDNDDLTIKLRLWFFHYTIKVPLIRVDKETKSIVVAHEEHAGEKKNEKEATSNEYTPDDILNTFKNSRELLQHVVSFHKIIRRFLRKISVHKLDWHTTFGIGDAATTGVLVGAGWAIKGGILGIISQYMRMKTMPTVTITPLFLQKYSHTKLTCMISFRIGNAILAGLRIVKFWKGGRPSIKNGPSFLKAKNNEKSMS